jgi:adenylate cyclase
MSIAAEVTCYQFDSFVLDLERGALLAADGEDVPLRHKSYRLLCLFVTHAGRLLERDTIAQMLWPGVAVADDGITQCVRDIRRALGDDSQRMIRMIPRRGYIFAAEVTTGHNLGPPRSDSVGLPAKPSIAVLAFANMSCDPNQENLGDGVADNVITELSQNRSLSVIARTSSFTYKRRPCCVQQIAHELGVQFLVEGSVQRCADNVRIMAQLIDADNGTHIWAERFDRNLSNVFAVQDEIAHAIAIAIDPLISEVGRRRAPQKPPGSLTAWEACRARCGTGPREATSANA